LGHRLVTSKKSLEGTWLLSGKRNLKSPASAGKKRCELVARETGKEVRFFPSKSSKRGKGRKGLKKRTKKASAEPRRARKLLYTEGMISRDWGKGKRGEAHVQRRELLHKKDLLLETTRRV